MKPIEPLQTRRIIQGLATALGVIGALLLVIEVGLRAGIHIGISPLRNPHLYAGWFEDEDHWKLRHRWQPETAPTNAGFVTDPVLGWRPPKSVDNPLAILSDGPYAHSSDRGALLFYGDSFVYGAWPAMVRHRIPQIVDRLLLDRPVYNYGVPGYGVDQIYLRFERTHEAHTSPAIIIGILTLDLDRSLLAVHSAPKPYFEIEDDELKLEGVPLPEEVATWHRQHPLSLDSYLVAFLTQRRRLAATGGNELEVQEHVPRKQALNSKILEAMLEARENDLPILFVLFYSRQELEYSGWRESFLRTTLDRLDVDYVDTKSLFLRRSEEERLELADLYYPDNGHLNETANCWVAEAVADRVSPQARPGTSGTSGLLILDPALSDTLQLGEPVAGPWPVESLGGPGVSCFSQTLLWLGEGEEQGVGASVLATHRRNVLLELDLVPGPSRQDRRRTLVLEKSHRMGSTREQREIDRPTSLSFNWALEVGENRFYLLVLDQATESVHLNGDTRPLMVQLRQIRVTSGGTEVTHSAGGAAMPGRGADR